MVVVLQYICCVPMDLPEVQSVTAVWHLRWQGLLSPKLAHCFMDCSLALQLSFAPQCAAGPAKVTGTAGLLLLSVERQSLLLMLVRG